MQSCDLLVIGGGSGGVRVARTAAKRGVRVMLVEQAQLGGTCVNVGCIPKKLYYYAAGFAEECRHASAFGYPAAKLGALQWAQFVDAKNAEIKRLNGIYQNLLNAAGVQTLVGTARLAGADTVQVGDETIRAKHILLASGGAPIRADIPGNDLAMVSNDLFSLTSLPASVVMIGGGYIALEFAGIFAGLGVQTTLCYRADLPMRGLDDDVRLRLSDGIKQHGVNICAGVSPVAIERDGKAYQLRLDNDTSLSADLIVFAIGRRPTTDGLGLENAGIEARPNGTLAVDASYRTTCPTVYAIGDLLQTPALTPVATAEAEVFVRHVFDGDNTARVDYTAVPTAIFSRPGVATCGVSELAAQKQGVSVAIYAGAFKPMKSGFAKSAEESFVKLVVEAESERVIGAQMLGDYAAEIMQGVAVAIKAGATKQDFDETVGIHPTSAEEFVTLRDCVR